MEGAFVARAAARSYRATGLFAGFFLLLGVVSMQENPGSWPVLAIAGGVTVLMLANLAYIRLAVGPDGIRYRTVRTHRALRCSDIKRAYFETSVNRSAPLGVATFWIEPREGKRLSINLRTFSPQVAAALLAVLDRHGVPLEVPTTGAAERRAREIRGLARPRPRRSR